MNNVVIRRLVVSLILAIAGTLVISLITRSTQLTEISTQIAVAVVIFITSLVSALASTNTTGENVKKSTTSGHKTKYSRETGTVKWFNTSKGFGFITRDNGDDVFVHFRSIRGQGRRTLIEGQRVEFNLTKGEKGLQAEDVAVAS